ncbi:Lrp/AsnC family transcriptional regulator [Pacificimonas sp. WHA3]|uniref:Lrp/AsnC family transcriptional regulator n=1 Tax=Pacificimonas pallii TaxID=2827236 RepID=A0ABS6SCI9_9SPHN|nr:Lrp/AsnC family transcriptional regulator [Pacificimonas pallii]
MDIDESDRHLLEVLQEDANATINDLAFASHLSPASVQRRLKRLRDKGVIQRQVAIVDQNVLDQKMSFVILVELERERTDQLDTFKRAAQREPQVQQCYYVTGEADFVLLCVARDMDDFEQLTRRLFFDNENVRRFRTSVVMDRTKVGLAVPVWPDDTER